MSYLLLASCGLEGLRRRLWSRRAVGPKSYARSAGAALCLYSASGAFRPCSALSGPPICLHLEILADGGASPVPSAPGSGLAERMGREPVGIGGCKRSLCRLRSKAPFTSLGGP